MESLHNIIKISDVSTLKAFTESRGMELMVKKKFKINQKNLLKKKKKKSNIKYKI